ncbi:MAG: hypothetical protein HYZ53_07125, partial [Planctomycetes bacterium]|nr:hypothetical protein [Planctomycetota bacterium]
QDFDAATRLEPAVARRNASLLQDARANAALGPSARRRPARDWRGAWARGVRAVETGDYATAERALRAGLAGFEAAFNALSRPERQRLSEEPGVFDGLTNAHLQLGRVCAARSSGREGPAAPGAVAPPAPAPTPDRAKRLREDAFTHLEAAVELGWRDVERLRADPELVPLHEDPRWERLLKVAGEPER